MNSITMKMQADKLIRMALQEDITSEDVSTNAVMRRAVKGTVDLIAKEDGIIAGLDVYARVFQILDEKTEISFNFKDGDAVKKGDLLGTVTGDIRVLLSGERVALNYLQRMSGIATYTKQVSKLLEGSKVTPIIGQLATVMGWIMDGIYRLLNIFGIQNIGLCIVIFSILIYALMTPLQIKQQKFSKLSAIMQPELQKIQKKYKGKNNDTAAMQKMQEETQAVYQKYGVSPTGSCVQLAIQFPILMALYQVIYKIPAYVGSVRDILASAVTSITGVNGYTDILQQFITDNKMTRVQLIMDGSKATSNSVTDFLYALSPSQWKTLAETSQFAGFTDTLNSTAKEISHVQNFFGLNIADQPLTYIKAAFVGGSALLAIVAILIPILAWATQMINLKLMPQAAQQSGDSQQDAMMNSMKTMNMVMPLMSAVFCFTFPVGLGIYWVASAAVRSVQQVVINKKMDKIQIEDLISENMKKMEKKREKAGLPPQKITNQAHQSAKNINKIEKGSSNTNVETRAKKVEEAYKDAANAKPGSITAKANLVKAFDERNKKK